MLTTTVGGAYSDSFITVAEADSLISGAEVATDELATWASLSSDAKELRLRAAAQLIGLLPLRGHRVFEYQALPFPRSVQLDVHVIPDAVKTSQALIAYLVVNRNLADVTSNASESGLLSDALVREVDVVGVMKVRLQHTLDASTIRAQSQFRPAFLKLMKAYGAPIWMLMRPYIAQLKGGLTNYENVTLLPSPDFTG